MNPPERLGWGGVGRSIHYPLFHIDYGVYHSPVPLHLHCIVTIRKGGHHIRKDLPHFLLASYSHNLTLNLMDKITEFKKQLEDECEQEGVPFVIAVGDAKNKPDCGFYVSVDMPIDKRGYLTKYAAVMNMLGTALKRSLSQ